MNFALNLFQTIIITSVVIMAVWLINKVTGSKTGYRWRKVLWLILAVRLIFPIPLNLSEHITSLRHIEFTISLPEQTLQNTVDTNSSKSSENTQTENVHSGEDTALEEAFSNSDAVNNMQTDLNLPQNADANVNAGTNLKTAMSAGAILTAIFIIWGIGILISISIRLFQYSRLKSKYLKNALLCEDASLIAKMNGLCNELGIHNPLRIIIHKNIKSPMLFGYINTILLLPEIPYSEAELDSVLRHELTHYRQKDLWYKLLMMFTCDLYWFNPIFRLMKRMAFRDVECICDEKATRHMSLEDKRTYCNSILKTMTGTGENNPAFTTHFACGKKTARQRLENILTSPNRKAGAAVFSLLLAALLMGTACVSFNISSNSETKKHLTIDSGILSDTDESLLSELKAQDSNLEIETADFDYQEYIIDVRNNAENTIDKTPTVFSSYIENVTALGKSGNIADITDILKERGWLDRMNDSMKELVSDENGRIYGIPKNPSYALGIMCNVEMFEAAGLVDEEGLPIIPETWQELADTAMKIKESTGEAGFCLLAQDYSASWQFTNIAWNFGAADFCTNNGDGTYTANLASDGAIEAMEFIKSLKWDYDVLTENPLAETYDTGYEHIGNGTAAMYISANDSVSLPIAYGLAPEKLALGPIPSNSAENKYSYYSGSAFTFSANATPEEIDAALSLIEIMGMGPVLNDANRANIRTNISYAASQNAPEISQISIWNNPEIAEYEQSVLAEYGDTNQALYKSYFDTVNAPGNLKVNTSLSISELYDEILKVMQEVLTDPDSDAAALLEKANANYQKALDAITY